MEPKRPDKLADVVLAALVGVTTLLSLYTFYSHYTFANKSKLKADTQLIVMTSLYALVVVSAGVVAYREYGYYLHGED